MRYLPLIILLMGCGKVIKRKTESLPLDRATPLEAQTLTDAINKIQADFDALGVQVNLKSLPYRVNVLGQNRAGICYKRGGKSIGIAIDHSMFHQKFNLPNYVSDLHRVLLHEIGHCFFDRVHEPGLYHVEGFDIKLWISELRGMGQYHSVMSTVMAVGGWHLIPDVLWPYYTKEIAGLDRINSWEDLLPYTEVELAHRRF